VRQLGPDRFEVGVHIADVCHFVTPGSALDLEAAARGNTFYLVSQRIDMVPKLLSENLCSLRSNTDRLAFSVILEMDREANVLSSRFAKTVVRSVASLSYQQAQEIIDDTVRTDQLSIGLRSLRALACKLNEKRRRIGAMVVSTPDVKFELDVGEGGHPTGQSLPIGMASYPTFSTNSLIEEFMVLANVTVGRELVKHFPSNTLLRCHPEPEGSAFKPLSTALQAHGIRFDAHSSAALKRSLRQAMKPDDPMFSDVVASAALRLIPQARYFCSGSREREDWRHYGLAEQIYTHFTSPIRRYADQVIHRLLAHVIDWEPLPQGGFPQEVIESTCAGINLRFVMAQHAERASAELYTLLYFRGKNVVEDAYVLKVREMGVQLLVPRYRIESFAMVLSPPGSEPLEYDVAGEQIRSADAVLRAFEKVRASISVNEDGLKPRLEVRIVDHRILNPSTEEHAVADAGGSNEGEPNAHEQPEVSQLPGVSTRKRFQRGAAYRSTQTPSSQ